MHLALSTGEVQPDCEPEEFVPFSQRSLYQSMRNLVLRTIQMLNGRISSFTPELSGLATRVCAREAELITHLKLLYHLSLKSLRCRIHGNFHLAQVLHTGKDFIFIDFEGESDRSFGERRLRRTPLRDVAGMIRSFHHVSHVALHQQVEFGKILPENIGLFEVWAREWKNCICAIYLEAYRETLGDSKLIPQEPAGFNVLLYSCLIEAAFTDLSHELLYAPEKATISLQAILDLLDQLKLQ